MMHRGTVTAIDTAGLWVQIAELGLVGPLPCTGVLPAVGDHVLVADTGEPSQPDLIVMTSGATIPEGSITSAMIANGTIVNDDINASAAIARSKISGLPTSSTDNTVARFDGTAGALQTSGVTISDGNVVGGLGAPSASSDAATKGYVDAAPVHCIGVRTTNQSFDDVTTATLTYTAETDAAGMLNTSTGVATIPTTGLWLITLHLRWESDFNGFKHIYVRNTSTGEEYATWRFGSDSYAANLTAAVGLSSGATLDVRVYQDSDGSKNVSAARWSLVLLGV